MTSRKIRGVKLEASLPFENIYIVQLLETHPQNLDAAAAFRKTGLDIYS
jgi:hypothetical protein